MVKFEKEHAKAMEDHLKQVGDLSNFKPWKAPQKRDIKVRYNAILITDNVDEAFLEPLLDSVEAYAAFYLPGIMITNQAPRGFVRYKCPQELKEEGSEVDKVNWLKRIAFKSQYGAKHGINTLQIHERWLPQVTYKGELGPVLEGDFGSDYHPLASQLLDVPSLNTGVELWLEYEKDGAIDIVMQVYGWTGERVEEMDVIGEYSEHDMKEPIVLPVVSVDGCAYDRFSVTFRIKGSGILRLGQLHFRQSRHGYGQYVLGGRRFVDERRQETFSYFNPGDLKPPLCVYFSGFRLAEGFEGYRMMKGFGKPFLLICDPRIQGGSFYMGTKAYENYIETSIQDALDYLGFSKHDLILSGLSMGTFGALYYASSFDPYGVVVGKPFTNFGDVVTDFRLKRPDEMAESLDVLQNVTGSTDQAAVDAISHKFWEKFSQSSFDDTSFAIAYMKQDDYDTNAGPRLLEHFQGTKTRIFTRSYEGRHNDASSDVTNWFIRQYREFIKQGFEEKTS